MVIYVFDRVENIVGKGENADHSFKYWSPAFSPFPTMFSNAFLSKVIKSQDCVVKS